MGVQPQHDEKYPTLTIFPAVTKTIPKSKSSNPSASASKTPVALSSLSYVCSPSPSLTPPNNALQALKRYNITDDWRQYALYIVHGDQERCLGLEEKPLLLFKQLDKEGRKPMFMLRKHAAPEMGWSNFASERGVGAGGGQEGGGKVSSSIFRVGVVVG